MNRSEINAFRARLGLSATVNRNSDELTRARKRQQNANRAARAQASRDIKTARGTRSKAK